MNASLLLAQTAGSAARSAFEWGRIQTESDWILPLAIAALVALYVAWMYRRDAAELPAWAGPLLALLRVAAFGLLLVIYLQPQYRNEHDVVTNSRVLLMVDSSLSMGLPDQPSGSAAPTMLRVERVAELLADGEWLAALRQRHDVVVARFDAGYERLATFPRIPAPGSQVDPSSPNAPKPLDPRSIDWAAQLDPRGSETRVGESLRQGLNEESTAPLAGVVLITDGQSNAGLDPLAVAPLAREIDVPLFPVGMGSAEPAANVRIADFRVPPRAFPNEPYKVEAAIQADGLAGQSVTVELFASKLGGDSAAALDSVAREQVPLAADGEQRVVEFTVTPTAASTLPHDGARQTLRLVVSAPAQDRDPTDNQEEADVQVIDRLTRVLLFAGGPTREYQFVRNLLKRDEDDGITVDVLLQTGGPGISQDASEILLDFPSTRDELLAYDCIIAFDPDWRELDALQLDLLSNWVAREAGGLIVVPGPVYTNLWVQDDRLQPVRDLYPVEFYHRFAVLDDSRFGSSEPWPIDFTREGLEAEHLWLADSSTASAAAWRAFPGVYGHYAVRRAKPLATVYARFSDPKSADGEEYPTYFAEHFYGSGRVFYLGSGEMWRIRRVEEANFDRFYTQLIRHVSQGRLFRDSPRGRLSLDSDRYALWSTVNVTAQLLDPRGQPLDAPSVTAEVIMNDRLDRTLRLDPDPVLAGSFVGQFAVRQEGGYRVEVLIPDTVDERLTRRFRVRAPREERDHPERNDPVLEALAEQTGGRYLVGLAAAIDGTPDVPPLLDLLRDRSRITTQVTQPDRLWDNWYVLATICGLLCLEWLIRRLLKLA